MKKLDRNKKLAAVGCAVLLLCVWWWTPNDDAAPGDWSRAQVFDAIRYVESGWRDPVPDGDGGRAIGPYQIHRIYWLDAIEFRPELGGDYQDCRNRLYAERVITAYMQMWVPDAWDKVDAEVIARTHNGGPTGMQKTATLRYWRRVRAALP